MILFGYVDTSLVMNYRELLVWWLNPDLDVFELKLRSFRAPESLCFDLRLLRWRPVLAPPVDRTEEEEAVND